MGLRHHLRDAPERDLRRALRDARARLEAIETGAAPATPDSAPNARAVIARLEDELRRRGLAV